MLMPRIQLETTCLKMEAADLAAWLFAHAGRSMSQFRMIEQHHDALTRFSSR